MQIREISLEEVWKIRQEVFWPNEPLDFIKMEKDPEGLHLGLFDPHLLSVVSLFKKGNEIQFRKLGTLNAFQGRGYGTHLKLPIFFKAVPVPRTTARSGSSAT